MKEKSLHNIDVNGAKKNVPDLDVCGNGDLWRLLCKASSQEEGWMKSAKVMEVGPQRLVDDDALALEGITAPLGCLVQVTTQQRSPDGSYAVAEALAFVPGAALSDFEFPRASK